MITLDLFESINEGAYSQLTPGSSALATANFGTLDKAFKSALPEIELDFGNQPLRINSKEINFLANYYDQLGSNELKTKFIYDVMPRFDRVYELLVKRGLRDPLTTAPDNQPELPGLQEKKESEYKDTRVARAMRQASAEFPSAASDAEAFAKSMLQAQDKDQEDINQLRQSTEKQRELLSKNLKLDREQDSHLSDIENEINRVEKENTALQQMQQQMVAANSRLQQTLVAMRGKKAPEPTPQITTPEPTIPVGVSVATDKEPEGYKYRQARLSAAQRALTKRLKQIDPAQIKDPTKGRGLGQMASQLAGNTQSQTDIEEPDLFATENKLAESGPETWTVHFTDGSTTKIRVPSDETDPAVVRKHFANQGRTVAKFDYGFSQEPASGPGPEAHEPGSGTAVSARTGERLPEGIAEGNDHPFDRGMEDARAGKEYNDSQYKNYQDKESYRRGRIVYRQEAKQGVKEAVPTPNRGGHNPLRDPADYADKRAHLFDLLSHPGMAPEDKQFIRQRLLDLDTAARKQGYTK